MVITFSENAEITQLLLLIYGQCTIILNYLKIFMTNALGKG